MNEVNLPAGGPKTKEALGCTGSSHEPSVYRTWTDCSHCTHPEILIVMTNSLGLSHLSQMQRF